MRAAHSPMMLTVAAGPNIAPRLSQKTSCASVNAKKIARVTMDMTSPFGDLIEAAVPDISIVFASKPARACSPTKWMTQFQGWLGSCRVPIIPGPKASGAQAPVLRRPARNAEIVQILGMTPSMSVVAAQESRSSSATEGTV